MRILLTFLTLILFTFLTLQLTLQQPSQSENSLIARMVDGTNFADRIRALDAVVSVASVDDRLAIISALREIWQSCLGSRLAGLSAAQREQRLHGLAILHHFVSESALKYSEADRSRDALLDMLLEVAVGRDVTLIPGETRVAAFRNLMELSPTEAVRIGYAREVIERESFAVGYLAANYLKHRDRLSEDMVAWLRTVLRASLEDDKPNILALYVLGHIGDAQILSDLERFVVERPVDRFRTPYVEGAIWQIKIQHPPAQLLDFLDNGRHDGNASWVVQRAVELGTPTKALRRAVRKYYERCPKDKLKLFRLMGLDNSVIELGLLEPIDLPE